jgi:hypothetical protein
MALSAPAGETPLARKVIGYWLLGCSGMVFGAVILGNLNIVTCYCEVSLAT